MKHRVYAVSLVSWSISYLSPHLSPSFPAPAQEGSCPLHTFIVSTWAFAAPTFPFHSITAVPTPAARHIALLWEVSANNSLICHQSIKICLLPSPFLTFSGFKIDSCLFERIGLVFLKNILRIANHRQEKHIHGVSEAGYYLLLGPATLSPPLRSAHCPPASHRSRLEPEPQSCLQVCVLGGCLPTSHRPTAPPSPHPPC